MTTGASRALLRMAWRQADRSLLSQRCAPPQSIRVAITFQVPVVRVAAGTDRRHTGHVILQRTAVALFAQLFPKRARHHVQRVTTEFFGRGCLYTLGS